MAETAPLHVQIIAKTEFFAPPDVPWSTDVDGGEALVEFAGRACYQSWSKPNPKTATNAGYLRHIIDVGHFSVLEHASVSFYITGISRSCTHELIRHRHFSYSQLSQRYVPEKESRVVVPPGPVLLLLIGASLTPLLVVAMRLAFPTCVVGSLGVRPRSAVIVMMVAPAHHDGRCQSAGNQ